MWRRNRKIETVLGPETRFEGILHCKGIIRIDGLVTGAVAEAEEVIVGETGKVEGDIKAKSVVVAGQVMGNITASDSIEMLPSSQVYGDISAPHLSIYNGVIFQGNCTMTREKTGLRSEEEKESEGSRIMTLLLHPPRLTYSPKNEPSNPEPTFLPTKS